MKMNELKGMSTEELIRKADELRKEKFTLRAQSLSGQLETPTKIRQARRDIARVLTELKLRAGAEASK